MNTAAKKELVIEIPAHPVPHKFIEPIMFLAGRMARLDKLGQPEGGRMIDQLNQAVGSGGFRNQPKLPRMTEDTACKMLELDTAKRAALVVLTLILKADTSGEAQSKEFFSRARKLMGADPIAVPSDIEEHKSLALKYLKG